MPFSVDGSGDVDAKGRVAHGAVRYGEMADSWWASEALVSLLMREWMEQAGLQLGRSLRRPRTTRLELVDVSSDYL
jgi:hypothetical protein